MGIRDVDACTIATKNCKATSSANTFQQSHQTRVPPVQHNRSQEEFEYEASASI